MWSLQRNDCPEYEFGTEMEGGDLELHFGTKFSSNLTSNEP